MKATEQTKKDLGGSSPRSCKERGYAMREVYLTDLARIMGLSVSETITLPSVVDAAAEKTGRSWLEIAKLAKTNSALRDYLKGVCAIAAQAL